jgi:hypothetical protein
LRISSIFHPALLAISEKKLANKKMRGSPGAFAKMTMQVPGKVTDNEISEKH